MDVKDLINEHIKELLYPILFFVINYLLIPLFVLIPEIKDNELIKNSLTLLLIILILIGILYILKPNIEFTYFHRRRRLQLMNIPIKCRDDIMDLYIDKNDSYIFTKIFSFLERRYSDKLYYQIFWQPKNAIYLSVESESVVEIDEYPSIPITDWGDENEYTIRFSIGNVPSCRSINLIIKKKWKPRTNPFVCLLFCLIKIRYYRTIIQLEFHEEGQ